MTIDVGADDDDGNDGCDDDEDDEELQDDAALVCHCHLDCVEYTDYEYER